MSLITVPHDLFRDCCALVVAKAGAKQVRTPRTQLSGFVSDGGQSEAKVLEYAIDGEIVARMVRACGETECWLRKDMAVETLSARADQAAEKERILNEVRAYAHASQQHARDQRAESYVLSRACVNAAARHQSKIGRLWDMNSRGDRVRANLASALDRAVKAEGGAK
jgi:hypothetical protein